MKSNKVNILTQYFALSIQMISMIDGLKGTPIYRHKIKSMLNTLQKELELDLELFYQNMENDVEMDFISLTEFTDVLTEVMLKKDVRTTFKLLKSYNGGEVGVMDRTKHKKIMNQIEKI